MLAGSRAEIISIAMATTSNAAIQGANQALTQHGSFCTASWSAGVRMSKAVTYKKRKTAFSSV